jgi:putative FmdB family regulatory protein
MPTYEYKCKKCGHLFEEFQKMSDPPLKKCPKCKGKVERLIGKGAGIIFKGSGFYQTDYKNKEAKYKANAESDKSNTSDQSKTSDTAKDKKPEKKETATGGEKNAKKIL